MAYKLLEMASKRWRCLNAPEMLGLVAVGVKFENGIQKDNEKDCAA